MQGCSESDLLSPQVRWGDNGARWVRIGPTNPLAALRYDCPEACGGDAWK